MGTFIKLAFVLRIKKLLRPFRVMFTSLLDALLLIVPRQKNKETKKQVLVVRLDAIGDFVIWLDAAKGLRKLYPEDTYRITLLANIVWASLAESLPYFDEVWSLEKLEFYKNLQYRWQQLVKVRLASFDIAVQPTFSREFIFGDSIIRISGANERIGSVSDFTHLSPIQKQISDAWYTKLVPATSNPLMELVRNAEFIRGCGLRDFMAALPQLPISNYTCAPNANYFVIFPGAFIPYRQWNINRFQKIAHRLYQATGWHVVACGGSGEEHLGVELARDAEFPLINRIGLTSLLDLAAIISGAKLVIANETSAIHIAAAVSTPAICILGGGHYGRFMPYKVEVETDMPLPVPVIHQMDCFGCNWQCIYNISPGQPMQCIDKITVEDVWTVVSEMIY